MKAAHRDVVIQSAKARGDRYRGMALAYQHGEPIKVKRSRTPSIQFSVSPDNQPLPKPWEIRHSYSREQLQAWGLSYERGWRKKLKKLSAQVYKTNRDDTTPDKGSPWGGVFDNPKWLEKFAADLTDKATHDELRLNDALSDALANRGIDLLFQVPVEKYILDLYIPVKRVAIEVDGIYHYTAEQWARDRERTDWLWRTKGIRVIRFDNDEIRSNLRFVIKKILKFCEI